MGTHPKKHDVYTGMLAVHTLVNRLWPSRDALRRRVAEEVRLFFWSEEFPRPYKLLELGCGEGDQTRFLLEIEECQLIALDCDAGMTDRVREQFADSLERGSLGIVTADAFGFVKQSETFLGVVTSWTIHNFRIVDRLELLEGIAERLVSGGCFVIMDKVLPDNKSKRKHLWKQHLRIHRNSWKVDRAAGDAIARHEKTDWSPGYRMIQNEFLRQLEHVFGAKPAVHIRDGADVVVSIRKK